MRHGFLLIDKPMGPTSHDAVQRVRNVLHEPKVGHLGTLDPAASGLLVLAVGAKALKVIELFPDLSKEYVAGIRFGAISSTYDSEGVIEEVQPSPGWDIPDEMQIRSIIRDRFTGKISQTPPAHSAVHVGGQRAYELARKGIDPKVTAREVTIGSCEILSYEYPHLSLNVACGSGTYIRSLAHDLGEMLHRGAYLSSLRRTVVGDWHVDNAVEPDKADWARVLPLKEILRDLHSIDLTEAEANDIRFGRAIRHEVRADTIGWFEDLPIAILQPAKEGSAMAKPRKVL